MLDVKLSMIRKSIWVLVIQRGEDSQSTWTASLLLMFLELMKIASYSLPLRGVLATVKDLAASEYTWC